MNPDVGFRTIVILIRHEQYSTYKLSSIYLIGTLFEGVHDITVRLHVLECLYITRFIC